MIGHGWTKKWLRDERVGFRRWRCRECLQAVTIFPPWYVPYVHDTNETIRTVIQARAEGHSWNDVKKWPVFPMRHISGSNTGCDASVRDPAGAAILRKL